MTTPLMNALKLLLFAAGVLGMTVSDLYAQKAVLYTGSPVVVKIAYLTPTEVVFDGEDIASVILGFAAESISLQNTANALFIQPLVENLSGDIFVVMKDGSSKSLSLVSTIPDLRDRSVRIINAVQQVSERLEKLNRSGLTPAGLIKGMILGDDMDGVSVTPTKQVIIDTPIQLIADTVYDALFLKGYVVDMTDHPNFDIKSISMKGLVQGAMHRGKAYFVFQGE